MTPNNALAEAKARFRTRCRALDLVRKHRPDLVDAMHYALDKHPSPYRSHWHAVCVLLEEVAEVVWALLRRDWENLEEELCHVEVVCVRWRDFAQDGPGRTKATSGDTRATDELTTRHDADSGQITAPTVFIRRQA